MAQPLVDDALWELIQPLLPPPTARRVHYPGRKPLDNRRALTGILFVLKSGIPWEMLPQEMGSGSGMTCWRRLSEWQAAGVWRRLHELLLAKLRQADQIDRSRAVVDSGSIRAVVGGGKNGTQYHGPAQTGEQAPRDYRGQGNPLGRHPGRR
jgi:transposase